MAKCIADMVDVGEEQGGRRKDGGCVRGGRGPGDTLRCLRRRDALGRAESRLPPRGPPSHSVLCMTSHSVALKSFRALFREQSRFFSPTMGQRGQQSGQLSHKVTNTPTRNQLAQERRGPRMHRRAVRYSPSLLLWPLSLRRSHAVVPGSVGGH